MVCYIVSNEPNIVYPGWYMYKWGSQPNLFL